MPRQARGPRLRQTSVGFDVPASVDGVVEQRILEQGSRIRTFGAVTGWASLRWQGARFFDGSADAGEGRLPVPLEVVGGDLRNRGLVVARMLSARRRATFLPPESCAWTLTPPPWWPPRA